MNVTRMPRIGVGLPQRRTSRLASVESIIAAVADDADSSSATSVIVLRWAELAQPAFHP